MKSLQFLTLCLVLLFSATSCVEQLGTDLVPVETKKDEKGITGLPEAPPPYIHSIANHCDKLGNYETVVVKNAHYSSTVHIDIYLADGTHFARYTKSNSGLLATLNFTVGYPTNGSKDCSILVPGDTYRIRVEANSTAITNWVFYNWPAWHINDSFTTITPCLC